ncbi:MAG: class I SAM-dependent methyltransferase [Lachnospiraceae bacterium]|nr:class I SAM-dependent methyltransferase [Lachnospiraceae bacterium]
MNRDYDMESKDNKTRKYAYNFDFDVMHPYMIQSFEPFMKKGTALELGCFQGAFTERIAGMFDEITCVEASREAITAAREKLKEYRHIQFVQSMFEDAKLEKKYDNIFLTHVLEHIDDRVGLLKKIKEEWLSENGVLFVACPNANAPSRQIAVKMGLIESNAAVTEAERIHGHRITYSLDTLESEIKKAEFNVIHKSGIFFKALANFQWDRLLETDIISKEYLDGCYSLGQQYPELCSSIYCVCIK